MTNKKNKAKHDKIVAMAAANAGELYAAGIIDPDYKLMPQYTKPPYDKMTLAEILATVKAKK